MFKAHTVTTVLWALTTTLLAAMTAAVDLDNIVMSSQMVVASAGATSFSVQDVTGITAGSTITISDMWSGETRTVATVTVTAGSAGFFTFTSPLDNTYSPGVLIVNNAPAPPPGTTNAPPPPLPATTDAPPPPLTVSTNAPPAPLPATTNAPPAPLPVTTGAPTEDNRPAGWFDVKQEAAEDATENAANVRGAKTANHLYGKSPKKTKAAKAKGGTGHMTGKGKHAKGNTGKGDGHDHHHHDQGFDHGKGSNAQFAAAEKASARKMERKMQTWITGVVGMVCVAVGVVAVVHNFRKSHRPDTVQSEAKEFTPLGADVDMQSVITAVTTPRRRAPTSPAAHYREQL